MIKNIINYEGLYTISIDGDVCSQGLGNSNNSTIKKLKPFLTGAGGYPAVRLYKNGKKKDFRVHRLVAIAFLDNPNNLPEVNHKDENKLNNHVDNLEWCTSQYNKEYSSSKHYTFISPEGQLVEVFNLSKFCKEKGISNGSMYHLISGKYRQCKGWTTLKYS